MLTRANVRLGLTGALLLFALGFAACADSPTEPNQAEECVWINGMIHCAPDR
ncbi:MAG: hypothetical protein GWM90_16135 [Gemmatimonadetes bacterium]|nr:hypothetical protein [Gemmatimonadota bacterium]NIQ55774.1 hypothetical protein [Gemmatimonadota bacterium]NIU75985.1 hypothetical protein [Gammaproteobacteria bacterium]NIX45573.1 hypothetical protein [Gemmatimonadota bacterium]NIY09858.1 hypothetical protein [Gemmatimonadota bacterium]